jgi:hypothetical protein
MFLFSQLIFVPNEVDWNVSHPYISMSYGPSNYPDY